MSKFGIILKHFDLSKKQSRSIKKVIRRTENERKNAKTHDRKKDVETAALRS